MNENNCSECGEAMQCSTEDYHYKECGLDNIMLRDVRICRCQNCGLMRVDVGDVAELHRDIAKRLIDQAGELDHNEAKFLCDYAVSRLDGWQYWTTGEA